MINHNIIQPALMMFVAAVITIIGFYSYQRFALERINSMQAAFIASESRTVTAIQDLQREMWQSDRLNIESLAKIESNVADIHLIVYKPGGR